LRVIAGMFMLLVDQNPLRSRVELASCLLVEASTSGSNQDLYLEEAWWHIEWALKLIKAEARPDPLALEALDELLPVYQYLCWVMQDEIQESSAQT